MSLPVYLWALHPVTSCWVLAIQAFPSQRVELKERYFSQHIFIGHNQTKKELMTQD
jgi:hypothetical protein